MAAFLQDGTGVRLAAGRRGVLAAAAGGTLLAALPLRQGRAAGPIGRLVESGPKPLPELSFTDADGQARGLGDFQGLGLVMNLWATWCPPCVAEMPALDRAQASLQGEGIRVLALSSDRGGKAQVEPFYQRTGIRTLAIWLDPGGAVQRALRVRGLPTTVIIDRAGQERARLEGAAEWDSAEMLAAVRRLVRPVRPEGPEAQGRT